MKKRGYMDVVAEIWKTPGKSLRGGGTMVGSEKVQVGAAGPTEREKRRMKSGNGEKKNAQGGGPRNWPSLQTQKKLQTAR